MIDIHIPLYDLYIWGGILIFTDMSEKKRILIVEDEKPIAKALQLKLSHSGFDAEVVHNGADAISYVTKNPVDMILLDVIMPVMDGFAVLESLKKKGVTTPVVMLSNLSQEEDEKRAKALGAKDFFIKSNTPLVEIVEFVKKFL